MAGVDILSDSTGKSIVAAIQSTDVAQARISEINQAAESKKNEVLASIPEDYRNTVDEVNQIKGDIFKYTGCERIVFSDKNLKQYINTNVDVGTVVSWDTPSVSSVTLIKWSVVDCIENDIFTINAKGGNSDRAWAFLDADKKLISKSDASMDVNGLIIVAPKNARYLVINDEDDRTSYIGEFIPKKIEDGLTQLNQNIAKFGYTEMYGNNLLEYDACEENKRIDSTNGNTDEISGAITTDYMRVENGKSYVFAILNSTNTGYTFLWNRYAVYDANRNFLYGDTFSGASTYSSIEITNENACFIRCSTSSQNIDGFKTKKAIFGDASYWVSGKFMLENYEEYAKKDGIPKEKIIGIEETLEDIVNIKTNVEKQGTSINKINSTIEIQKEYFVDDFNTVNRCDNSKMTLGLAIYPDNGETYENASYISTDYIDVGGLTTIALYSCITDSYTPYQEFWRGAWYGEDKSYMSGLNNQPIQSNPQRGVLTVPDGARYVRVCFVINNNFSKYMCTSDGTVVDYVPYSYGHKEIIIYPDWIGKTWLSYGDSITAIGNPTYIDGKIGEISEGSWQRKVRDYLHMGQCYGRGIGGQTFTYNARPWFANPDGTYNSRDDNGDMTDPSSYTVPDGCTAHYGYFASWDRICTMIPDSIKDSIDLITVFGVNDAMAALNFDPTTWTAPQWRLDSELTGIRDEAWLAADESILYSNNHGDFDITDLSGAIASTILKLQARCPNAVIVFGTSWSGKGGGESAVNTGDYDTDGIAYYKHGQLVKTVAHYYSIPVVDIWGTSGVNPFNRNANNQDSTHPYKPHGKMMLARAWISGLKGITAMID